MAFGVKSQVYKVSMEAKRALTEKDTLATFMVRCLPSPGRHCHFD